MIESLITKLNYQELFINLRGRYVKSLINAGFEQNTILLVETGQQKYLITYLEDNKYQIITIAYDKALIEPDYNIEDIINEDSNVSGYICNTNIFGMILGNFKTENFKIVAEKIEWSLALNLAETELRRSLIIFHFQDEINNSIYFRLDPQDREILFLYNSKEILVNNDAKNYIRLNLTGSLCTCRSIELYEKQQEKEIKEEIKKEKGEEKYDTLAFFISEMKKNIPEYEQIEEVINSFFENKSYLGFYFTFRDEFIVERFSILTDFAEQFYKKFPKNLYNIYFLIALYRSQENFEDELNIVKQAIEYFPNNTEIIILASKIYDRNQLTTQSYQVLKEALEREDIEKLSILEQLSTLYRKYQKHTDQILVLDNILEIANEKNDNDALFRANYYKALALVNLGRDSESIQYFETAISLNKSELGPYQNLANVAERAVNLESAISVLNRALENTDAKDKVYNLMGSLYVKNQMYQEALESYSNLIQLKSDDTSALLQIGTIYMLLGDNKTAKLYFEKVLEIDPENIGAKNNLKSLLVIKKKRKKKVDKSEYDIITRKRYSLEEIEKLLPEETRKSLEDIEKDDFRFNKAEFNRIYFKAFSKGIGFTARSSYFFEALKYAYLGKYLDGLIASAINYFAAYGLELSKVHKIYSEAFYYYGALFDLLAICTDVPFNIKTLLSRHLNFFIKNINKFKNNYLHLLWALLLTAKDDKNILELLFRKLQTMNPQHKIVISFIDALIDIYTNNEEEYALEVFSLNWPQNFRENFAAHILSSEFYIKPVHRRELLGIVLNLQDKTDNDTFSTIGLLSNLGDNFFVYRQENLSQQDKNSYHNKILNDLINIPKHIFKTFGKRHEGGIFQRTLNILSKEIKKETEKIILFPDLDFQLITKNIPLVEESYLIINVTNKGSGPANNVNIKINTKDGIVINEDEEDFEIGIISTKQSVDFEKKISPLKEGEFPITFNISYTNLKNETEVKEFTEVISIYSATDFQWIESPYITGLPVQSPEMFFGRQDTIEMILSKLKGVYQDNVLILHGQRRTGKTSILYQLKDYHVKKPYIPVLIDMQKLKSAETRRLCRKIAELTLDEFSNKKIKYLEIEREKFAKKFEEDPIGTLDDFFDDLNRNFPDYKILILFDEFEGLIRNIIDGKVNKDFLDVMRGWMQHSKNVRFIITGADKLREMMENYWSPLFQIAEFITIGYLKNNEAKDLIIRPVLNRLEYDENAVSKIINVTSSNPYYIQLLCQKIIERMNYLKRKKVTVVDVDKVIEENLIIEGTYFDHLWEQSNDDEKIFLSCLSELSFSHEDWIRFDDLMSTLRKNNSPITEEARFLLASRNLKNRGIIEQRDVEGDLLFKITIDLFRLRCKNYQPLSRVLREVPVYE